MLEFSKPPPFPEVLLLVMIELETFSVPPEKVIPAPFAVLVFPEMMTSERLVMPAPVTFKPAPLLAPFTVTPLRWKLNGGIPPGGTGTVNTSPAVLRVMLAKPAPGPRIVIDRVFGAVKPEG